jgi:glycosyltransferase involved in cell wall biosynthesis
VQNKLNIKYICWNNPLFEAKASSNRVLGLLNGLAKHKTNVEILVVGGYQSFIEFQSIKNNKEFQKINITYLNKTHIQNKWVKRIYNYLLLPIHLKWLFIRLIFKNQYFSNSIIWVENSSILYSLAKKLKRINNSIKLFIEVNEFFDFYINIKGNYLSKRRLIKTQKSFKESFVFELNGIAFMTKSLIHEYSFLNPNLNILHLPMTVDFSRFKAISKSTSIFQNAVYLGDLNNSKDGVDIIIKSFAKIMNEHNNLNLFLVGKQSYDHKEHMELISELKAKERIYFLGLVSKNEVPSILINATLLLLARPDSRQAQGGFPTKLGEYLATKNPVCVTSVGEIPDYLKDNESAFFAKPGCEISFADAMNRALKDLNNSSKIGENGYLVALENFNSETQSKRLFNFLTSL